MISDIIRRQRLIVSKCRGGATLEEIHDHLERQSYSSGRNYRRDDRTIGRDIKDILETFGVEIRYNRSDGRYHVVAENYKDLAERLFEVLDIYDALSLMEKASPYLLVEKGQQQGTEHLHPLLDAMEKHKKISLTY